MTMTSLPRLPQSPYEARHTVEKNLAAALLREQTPHLASRQVLTPQRIRLPPCAWSCRRLNASPALRYWLSYTNRNGGPIVPYLESLFSLRDKNALVTGAASGLGRHCAVVLAQAGGTRRSGGREPGSARRDGRDDRRGGRPAPLTSLDPTKSRAC